MTHRRPDWITTGAIMTLLATTGGAAFLAHGYRADADRLRVKMQWQCPRHPQPVVLPRPLKRTA